MGAPQTADADNHADVSENTVYMRIKDKGTVTIELNPEIAPLHAERVKQLTTEGFYDGVIFHRVIDGFMAQTGDPTGTGMGGSKMPDLPAEFTQTEYKRGTIGMARSSSPNSANSQFFICFTDTGCSFLKGQYTVLGEVTDGMSVIDAVNKGEPPASPDVIEKMMIAGKKVSEKTNEIVNEKVSEVASKKAE